MGLTLNWSLTVVSAAKSWGFGHFRFIVSRVPFPSVYCFPPLKCQWKLRQVLHLENCVMGRFATRAKYFPFEPLSWVLLCVKYFYLENCFLRALVMAHPFCWTSILGSERQVCNHHHHWQVVEYPLDARYCTEYLKRNNIQKMIPK